MAEFLWRPPFLFGRWRNPQSSGRTREQGPAAATDAEMAAAHELSLAVQSAVGAGQRLLESLRQSVDNEPLANAASICRWELLVLRERVRGASVPPRLKPLQMGAIRDLDAAASAAHMMGNGYRFHNLDRICQGGESLETQLAALDRLKARLDAHLALRSPEPDTPVCTG